MPATQNDPYVKHTVAVICRESEWREFRAAVIREGLRVQDVVSDLVAEYTNGRHPQQSRRTRKE
jgi:hypothetical protein